MDKETEKVELQYIDVGDVKDNQQCIAFKKNNSNVYEVTGLKPNVRYSVKIRCNHGRICSKYTDSIRTKTFPRLVWDQTRHGGNVTFISDIRVKYGNQRSIVVSKNAITSSIYKSFQWKMIIYKCSYYSWIGFIGGSIDESIKDWHTYFGGPKNKTHYVSACYENISKCPNVRSGDYILFKVNFVTQKGTAIYKDKTVKTFNNFGNQIFIGASNNTSPAEYMIECVSCEYV